MITRLPQYVTAKDSAKSSHLKTRTIYDQMKRNEIRYVTICGNKMVVENTSKHVEYGSMGNLELVQKFARKHKFSPDTIYRNIIMDKINAVVIGNLILINPEDETVVNFLKTTLL